MSPPKCYALEEAKIGWVIDKLGQRGKNGGDQYSLHKIMSSWKEES